MPSPQEPEQGPVDSLASKLSASFRKAVNSDVTRLLKIIETHHPDIGIVEFLDLRTKLETARAKIEKGGVEGFMAAKEMRTDLQRMLKLYSPE